MKIKSNSSELMPALWKSKVGHLTLVFPFFGRRVKIYQAENSTQADFIQKALQTPELAGYFHPLFFTFNRYLLAEWVRGASCDTLPEQDQTRAIDWMVELQSILHSQHLYERDEQAGFDYLDHLENRLLRHAPPEMDPDMIRQLRSLAGSPPVEQSRLSHPDITLRNSVLAQDSGRFKLIDNELFTQSPHFLLDVFNTAFSLAPAPGLRRYYLERYASSQVRFSLRHGWESSLAAAWSLRLAGSHFQAGRLDEGLEVLRHWPEGNQDILEMLAKKQ